MGAAAQRSGQTRRYVPGRNRQVRLRYCAEEYALLVEAAASAGLTPSGYAAEAALAAARGVHAPSLVPVRQALVEVMAARSQVRRFAATVDRAAAALSATGTAPAWLATSVALTDRAVARLDASATQLARTARRRAAGASPTPPPHRLEGADR